MAAEHNTPTPEQKTCRINNTLHLWEFLLELLEDERYSPLIAWTRKEKGEFKIKRQEDVARKWGRLKQRSSMNYDKLSRALRYYYHKGIIKKVHGQRLVYKFDKLPYSYKPVRYNWPWKLPGEDQDIISGRRVSNTPSAPEETHWPVFFEWNKMEKQAKPIKPDIVKPPAAKETSWPVIPARKDSKVERNGKPDKQVPPLVPLAENACAMPSLCSIRRKQNDKPDLQKKIPPLVSITTHLHTTSTWENPKRNQRVKPAEPREIAPLAPVEHRSPAIPGNGVPISMQCQSRNEFRYLCYPSQHPSQAICRSQIIFPPCSCMRPVVCGMYMIPDASPLPVQVTMR